MSCTKPMDPAVGLDMVKIIQYFHDQFVPRLEEVQDAFNRREFASPRIDEVQREVDRSTAAVEELEAVDGFHGDGAFAELFDTLGYAGRESGMGAPFKGWHTRFQQRLAILQSSSKVPQKGITFRPIY